jgi:hypothetical protein
MYAPFQGRILLQSYQTSRMAVARRRGASADATLEPDRTLATHALSALQKLFDVDSAEAGERFRMLVESWRQGPLESSDTERHCVDRLAKALETPAAAGRVATLDLLHALVAVQLTDVLDADIKQWLDRLVQRFEVTKKLYEFYGPGFSKGGGSNTSIRLYWLFALALCLFYARSYEIKYLSTLLKVADLLCSVPELMLQGNVPENGLSAVLAAEIVSVQLLSERKGVAFASN